MRWICRTQAYLSETKIANKYVIIRELPCEHGIMVFCTSTWASDAWHGQRFSGHICSRRFCSLTYIPTPKHQAIWIRFRTIQLKMTSEWWIFLRFRMLRENVIFSRGESGSFKNVCECWVRCGYAYWFSPNWNHTDGDCDLWLWLVCICRIQFKCGASGIRKAEHERWAK